MRVTRWQSFKVSKGQGVKVSRCELGVIKREERATVATNRVGFVFIT